MRQVTDRIAQWGNGRYFLTWAGEEFLLEATNDADAIAAGEALLAELNQE